MTLFDYKHKSDAPNTPQMSLFKDI